MQKVDLKKLTDVIEVAEKFLDDNKDLDNKKINRKKKNVTTVLESAYELLNRNEYTQKEVNKKTDDIWEKLIDNHNALAFIIIIFGMALSGVLIFTVFQAYSFIQINWDPEMTSPNVNQEVSNLVNVNYVEENIISLYDQMTVSDQVGLKNKPQEFRIENDSSEVKGLNYIVHYSVNIVPMNDPHAKLLNKKYIKYKYIYKDSKRGKYYESKIGTLDELTENPDGSLLLTKSTQAKDTYTDFKVYFWISSLAKNDQQGASYTMAFKVNAAVAKS